MKYSLKNLSVLQMLIVSVCMILAESAKGQSGTYNGFNWSQIGTNAVEITGYYGPGGAVIIPLTISNLSVTSIGYEAFFDLENITSVIIPNSVTNIGDEAFSVCKGLANITIPNSVISIGENAFDSCLSLTAITIPNSVTSIGEEAFDECTNLTSIVIPNSVNSMGYGVFYNCLKMTSVTLPSRFPVIEQQTFVNCISLTTVTIPNSVTIIGDEAFGFCASLTKITIPNSVTSIQDVAFASCTNLASIIIPNSVTSIGRGAFSNCARMTNICFEGNAPIGEGSTYQGSAFDQDSALSTIYYINGTTGWGNTFGFVKTAPCAQCGSVISIPIVKTLAPSSVGNLSAALNGTVNPNGVNAIAYFQYGTDTNYGRTTTSGNIGNGTNYIAFSANLTSLALNTIYHYRAVATVFGISYYGADQTVTTEPSLLALANLCSDVYLTQQSGYAGPVTYRYIGNFNSYVSGTPPGGFYVAAYVSPDNSQIVIAFRGTVLESTSVFVPGFPTDIDVPTLTTLENIYSDYGFRGNTPTILLEHYVFSAAQFVNTLEFIFTNANITITGHSLGGALAQLVGQASGLTTVGFNAPGAGKVYSALVADNDLFEGAWLSVSGITTNVNYRIDGDQISQIGDHIGSIITIEAPAYLAFQSETIWDDALTTFFGGGNFNAVYQCHVITTVIAQIAANAQQLPGAIGPNVSEPIADAIQPVSNSTNGQGQTVYNFNSPVTSATGYIFDPNQSEGTDFVVGGNAGTPNIAIIDLPAFAGIAEYVVRSETGGTWSAFQSVKPGIPDDFGNAGVNGLEFVPLDANGNPVVITGMVYGLYFTSSGTFSGTLSQSSVSPTLPVALQISVVTNQLNLAWNTNSAAGFALVTTTNLVPPTTWSAVTNIPLPVNSQLVVKMPITGKSQFFRLSR